jgi:antitoxin CptB
MAEPESRVEDGIALRKRRLSFRCWHRGTKELDLLMGPFADRYLAGMAPAQLDQLEHLMSTPDLDLYNWIAKREPVPDKEQCEVLELIINFHHDK